MANERKDEAIREVEKMRDRIAKERADLKTMRDKFRTAFDRKEEKPAADSESEKPKRKD